jgi:hypothetical protein
MGSNEVKPQCALQQQKIRENRNAQLCSAVNSSATKILHDPMRSGASAQQRAVRSGRIIHGCRLAGKVDPPRQWFTKMAALIRPRTDRGV